MVKFVAGKDVVEAGMGGSLQVLLVLMLVGLSISAIMFVTALLGLSFGNRAAYGTSAVALFFGLLFSIHAYYMGYKKEREEKCFSEAYLSSLQSDPLKILDCIVQGAVWPIEITLTKICNTANDASISRRELVIASLLCVPGLFLALVAMGITLGLTVGEAYLKSE